MHRWHRHKQQCVLLANLTTLSSCDVIRPIMLPHIQCLLDLIDIDVTCIGCMRHACKGEKLSKSAQWVEISRISKNSLQGYRMSYKNDSVCCFAKISITNDTFSAKFYTRMYSTKIHILTSFGV